MSTTVNTSGYNFTIIIPYKHSFKNNFLLKKVLEYYTPFTLFQLIIVEQGKEKTLLENDYLHTDYILAKTEDKDTPYNPAWLYNIGVKYAKSDIILFANTTDLINPNAILQSIDLFQKQSDLDAISLQNQYYLLTKEQIKLTVTEILPLLDDKTLNPRYAQKSVFDGLFMMRKSSYDKVSGINEDLLYYDLGAQSNLFLNTLKLATLNETIGVKLIDSKFIYGSEYVSEERSNKSKEVAEKINGLITQKSSENITKYVKALKRKNGVGYKYV